MFARLASARSAVRVLAVRVLPRSHPLHLWHAAFVVLGFATGAGFVPAALPYVAIVALLVGVVLFVDLPRLVRRERPHAFGFAKAFGPVGSWAVCSAAARSQERVSNFSPEGECSQPRR